VVAAGLAATLAVTGFFALSTRRGYGDYAGLPSAVSLPAGTLVQPARALPRFELIDEHGRAMSLASFRGRWLVLAPAMTLCHEVCPLTTAVLDELSGELRREGLAGRVAVAEITVDPWRDRPARLRAYRQMTGASFPLLTGTAAEIHRLWSFLGVFYERVPAGVPAPVDWLTHRAETFDVQHTDGVFIVDPAGRERVAGEGMAAPGATLPRALGHLLDAEGRQNLAGPESPWTAGEVLADLGRLAGVRVHESVPAPPAQRVRQARRRPVAVRPAGSARPLRALQAIRAEGGRLLGGYGALAARLARLRGLPVVLNVWASWCPPCRKELPLFEAVARRRGRSVAFLGVDADDSAAPAESLLSGLRLPYPSYQTTLGALGKLAPVVGTPTTIFVDRAGGLVYVHDGQYGGRPALEEDVERYALARG
jgi:protein SCO1/2